LDVIGYSGLHWIMHKMGIEVSTIELGWVGLAWTHPGWVLGKGLV